MARILLHTLVYAPDGVSTATLLSELAQDLQANGHEITILTTKPHYNRDEDAEAKQPLHKRLGGLYHVSEHHGMRVIHTYMPPKGQGLGNRLRHYVLFHVLSLILGALLIGRQDVVIAPSPPLSIGVVAWILARLKSAKFVYNIQELYPALAVQMGIMSPESSMYRLMVRLEHFIYQRADKITVICDYFHQQVLKIGLPDHKVLLIPNFVDIDFIRPLPKANALAHEHKLLNKFVIQYAGNIGMTQSFDTILEVACRLQDEAEIHFLIVGDGARRHYVEQQLQAGSFPNITLLPYQPRSHVPHVYASADLCLVPLMTGTAQTTVPSKIYTIMASGRPVLTAVDQDSELVTIVQTAKCGLAVPPDDADALEAGIRQIFAERVKFKEYGSNGRSYVEAHFSRDSVSAQYHRLIQQLVEQYEVEPQTVM